MTTLVDPASNPEPCCTAEEHRPSVALVCGGKWHDFGFARLQLLLALAAHPTAHLCVFDDYPDNPDDFDALITYTCALPPAASKHDALVRFVHGGGRWLALHATNAAIEAAPEHEEYAWVTPRDFGPVASLLGSQFLGHPPIQPYTVNVVQPEHPLVKGIESFTVTDELYVSDVHGPIEIILATTFKGRSPSFEEGDVLVETEHPVLYARRNGLGEVVYFTLGHCRGRYDVRDLGVRDTGIVDRGSWESTSFREILGRAVGWVVHGRTEGESAIAP